MTMHIKKITALVLAVSTMLFSTGIFFLSPEKAIAGSLTVMSDTMSNQNASGYSTHLVKFRTPTALDKTSNGTTIVIAFPSDFDFTGIVIGEITMTSGASTGLETPEVLAASPDATKWGAVFSNGACGASKKCTLTLTSPDDGQGARDITTNDYVAVAYTATHALNPTSIGSKTISITTTGNANDTGSLAVPIITDDTVTIDATVAPTITFTNDQSSLHFGTLNALAPQYAIPTAGGSASDLIGNTFRISTNATGGYTLTYAAADSLKSGSDIIDAATFTNDADGAYGTEQFAMSAVYNGTIANLTTAYRHATLSGNWSFVPAGDILVTNNSPLTTSETVEMHYIANISSTTPAGIYSQVNTWRATGNF